MTPTVYQLNELMDDITYMLKSRHRADNWMRLRHPGLGRMSPQEMLMTGEFHTLRAFIDNALTQYHEWEKSEVPDYVPANEEEVLHKTAAGVKFESKDVRI